MSKDSKIVKDNWWNRLFVSFKKFVILTICVIVCVFVGILLLHWYHNGEYTGFEQYNLKLPSILGLYGDFIGGVFGTVVAVLSVFYLIRTLKEQESANNMVAENNLKVIEVYNQQQFNDKCQNLLNLYNQVKNSYSGTGNSAGEKLKNIIDNMLESVEADAQSNYAVRLNKGCKLFDTKFYTMNRTEAAVHFRVLYQLFGTIYDFRKISGEYSDSNDEYAASYSKLVRSQLNESELVLLRYNCFTGYGENMKLYINQYNLLKHLPLMSLYEFKRWSDIIGTENINLRNALDTELIAQRKWLKEYFNGEKQDKSRTDKKYSVWLSSDNEKKSLKYCIRINKELSIVDEVDQAFEKIGDNLPEFMNDFLHEALEYSNFKRFNNTLEYEMLGFKSNQDQNMTYCTVSVTAKEPIVLTQYQQENRNPKEENPVKIGEVVQENKVD